MAGPCRIPKLTVRVRFPSPAPHAESAAAVGDSRAPPLSEGQIKQINAILTSLRPPGSCRPRHMDAHPDL